MLSFKIKVKDQLSKQTNSVNQFTKVQIVCQNTMPGRLALFNDNPSSKNPWGRKQVIKNPSLKLWECWQQSIIMHGYRETLYREQYTKIDQTYETINLNIALDLAQLTDFCLLGLNLILYAKNFKQIFLPLCKPEYTCHGHILVYNQQCACVHRKT